MNKILNGPVIKNQSEDFERIIVFLHGYGANGNDLISIGNAWQKVIPKTIFLSPNAPFDCPFGNDSYQWFEFTSISPESIGSGLNKAGPYLHNFIDHISLKYSIPFEKIFLYLSQGTMMALYHLCQRESKVQVLWGIQVYYLMIKILI